MSFSEAASLLIAIFIFVGSQIHELFLPMLIASIIVFFIALIKNPLQGLFAAGLAGAMVWLPTLIPGPIDDIFVRIGVLLVPVVKLLNLKKVLRYLLITIGIFVITAIIYYVFLSIF